MARRSPFPENALRLVRYFLPQLGPDQLNSELDVEVAEINRASEERSNVIRRNAAQQREEELGHQAQLRAMAATQTANLVRAHEKQLSDMAMERRCLDANSEGKRAIAKAEFATALARDQKTYKASLEQLNSRRTRGISILILSGAPLLITAALTFKAHFPNVLYGVAALLLLIPVVASIFGLRRTAQRIIFEIQHHADSRKRTEDGLASRLRAIDEDRARALAALGAKESALEVEHQEAQKAINERRDAELAARAYNLDNIETKATHELAAESTALGTANAHIAARKKSLLECYKASVASEAEVTAAIEAARTEVARLVFDAVGMSEDQVLDERSAEIWSPTVMQVEDTPMQVNRDAQQSEEDIVEQSGAILSPLRPIFNAGQWDTFRIRVGNILGLSPRRNPSSNGSPRHSGRLNPLTAVRFGVVGGRYLAGHYFYQRIICGDTFVAVFRAYVNVLDHRVSSTNALQIPFADVAAIHIETGINVERYDAAAMTINQHTHTLTLELTSGSKYRMSGDAGSMAEVESRRDDTFESVKSNPEDGFRRQIHNVRALVHDVKTGLKTGE